MINHKDSPGLPDEVVVPIGLPSGAGHGMFESPVISCSHCQAMVVLNPQRTRDRAYCPKCDKYVCDNCEKTRVATGVCKTFAQLADEIIENAIKQTLVKEI